MVLSLLLYGEFQASNGSYNNKNNKVDSAGEQQHVDLYLLHVHELTQIYTYVNIHTQNKIKREILLLKKEASPLKAYVLLLASLNSTGFIAMVVNTVLA